MGAEGLEGRPKVASGSGYDVGGSKTLRFRAFVFCNFSLVFRYTENCLDVIQPDRAALRFKPTKSLLLSTVGLDE